MADDDDNKQGHTLTDHVLGQDFVHEHDGDADHDHDHFEFDADGPLEDNPIWIQDHVTLVSVGIDIGSSGTQVIFSRINLRRYGEDLTSRYYVVSRETLFQSPVALTPYPERRAHRRRRARRASSTRPMRRRGVKPGDIDTGVVILTGEALRRENAAGHRRTAGGAGRRFRHRHRRASHGVDARRLRLRRGAGVVRRRASASSTSISAAARPSLPSSSKGDVIATAAVHIGGRLQVVDDIGRIVRLDPGRAATHAARGRLRLERGDAGRSPRAARQGGGDAWPIALVAGAHAAAAAARGRASLPDRSDRRARAASTA